MAQAPLFKCAKCGVEKPHDIEHFTVKFAYVRKREWGKLPTTVCKECKRKQVSETMKRRWKETHDYQAMRDQERAEEMARIASGGSSVPGKASPEGGSEDNGP